MCFKVFLKFWRPSATWLFENVAALRSLVKLDQVSQVTVA